MHATCLRVAACCEQSALVYGWDEAIRLDQQEQEMIPPELHNPIVGVMCRPLEGQEKNEVIRLAKIHRQVENQ